MARRLHIASKVSMVQSNSQPLMSTKSIANNALLSMAIRISLVIVATSLLSYWHLVAQLQASISDQLALFVSERAQVENQWLGYLDQKLLKIRQDYIERYQRLQGQEPSGQFDRFFKMNADGSAYVRSEYFSGTPDAVGKQHKGYSGGMDKVQPFTPERRLQLILSMDMLFDYGPAMVQPATATDPALTPFVNLYFFLKEKDLLVYWPNLAWYPDYQNNFDLAEQGDFKKTFNMQLPMDKRERLWTATYLDEVAKVWMTSYTMPIDLNGKNIGALGADISLADLNSRLQKNKFTGASNLIMRADGQLIADPTREQALIQAKGAFNLATNGDASLQALYRLIREHPGQSVIDDKVHKRLIAVGKIEATGWLFVAEYPKSLLNNAAIDTVWFIFGLGVLSLMVEVAMLWLVMQRKVAQPLHQFLTTLQEVSRGNLGTAATAALPLERHDEIGTLAIAFSTMVMSMITDGAGISS